MSRKRGQRGAGDASGGGSGGGEPAGARAGLPPKQQEAVLALLEHATVKSAAASCGVAERTLYRWMAEGPFNRAYREARRGSFGHSVSLAQRFCPMAITTLEALARDPTTPPAVRATACMSLAKIGRESIELDELVGRVEGLEQASREQQQQQEGGSSWRRG